jgi:hypothetical protein
VAYGQKNYADIQGINGKYRISQIGCFLTSFCNLLERFGRGLPPNQLNNIFKNRGVYIDVDDGIRDDLGWQSVVAYDGQIALQKTGTGTPPHKNSIVRIAAANSFGTHFCLVDRIEGSTVYIVDSWDGAVKNSNVYGPITGWAAYGDIKPQPVIPIGVRIMDTDAKVKAQYFTLRGSEGTAAERAGHLGKTYEEFNTIARPEAAARAKQLADLKIALANEQNKPPREIVKEVQVIVEKLVEIEKPVEVIKEVEVEPGWLKTAIAFIRKVLHIN